MKRIVCILLVVFCIGCASKVTTTNMVPPRAGEFSVQRVAVMDIENDRNGYFSTALASVLAKVTHDGKTLFTIMDRGRIDNILQEQQFQMSIADPSTIMELGRLTGLEGGFHGSVHYNSTQRYVTEERSDCSSGTCYKYTVSCTEDDVVMDVTLNLIDYQTTTILYSKPQSRSIRVRQCPDEDVEMYETTDKGSTSFFDIFSTDYTAVTDNRPQSVSHLINTSDPYVQMSNDMLSEIAKDFGEYEISSVIEVSDDTKGISGRDEDIFDAAVANAENGSLEKACDQWQSIEAANPNSIALKYNLGVCKEAFGDFDAALKYYQAADSMLLVSDEKIQDALTRLKNKKR